MIDYLKGEIWKQYRDTPYYASNCGRIKHVYKSGKERLLTPFKIKQQKGSSYMAIKIHSTVMKLAIVIYESFNGPVPKNYAVVHRNRVISDNNLVNLKVVSRRELGLLYGGRTSMRRLIYCLDNKKIYKGTREAAKDLHISRQTVSDYCNNRVKKPMYQLRWMKDNE